MSTPSAKADQLFAAAFPPSRCARSAEYKQGVRDVLRYRLGVTRHVSGLCDYTLGTVQADAYLAGCDEGHRIAREHFVQLDAAKATITVSAAGRKSGPSA